MKTIESVVSMALMAMSLVMTFALLDPVRAPQQATLATAACEDGGVRLVMGCENMHL